MEKKVNVGKEIAKTILKTLAIITIIVVFSALGFYVVNPRFSAGVCEKLGWQNAEISCYELLYARNKDDSDLYNLIVKLGNVDEYQKQNDYIDKLQMLESYSTFCNNMDASVLDAYNAGEVSKNNLALLYGTNEYLTSTKSVNLIKQGKYEEAYNCILASKNTDKTYELSVYNFVENLYASDASNDVKDNYFTQIEADFGDYLEQKYSLLPLNTTGPTKILVAYTKLKIEYTQYIIALQNNAEDIADRYVHWQESQNVYNNLII